MTAEERKKVNPRVVFFAGKAAPGYYIAKLTIRLIVNVARVINKDPETSPYLQMYFLPDYSVSLAEVLIPASDLSQHSVLLPYIKPFGRPDFLLLYFSQYRWYRSFRNK